MAASLISSAELTDASRATNAGSQSITVPSSCTGIAVFAGGFLSGASQWSGGSVSLSTDGALTASATGADAGGTTHQGAIFYRAGNLTSGAQTLSWNWVGTTDPADGALMVVAYIAGSATASAIRDSDGIQSATMGDSALHSTKSLTAQSGDLILGWWEMFADATVAAPAWTNATKVADYDLTPYRGTVASFASAAPSGNQTVGVTEDASSSFDGSLQAIVVKASSGIPDKAGAGIIGP